MKKILALINSNPFINHTNDKFTVCECRIYLNRGTFWREFNCILDKIY